MNKRKLICLMAAAMLCFSAASCGDKEKPPIGSTADTTAVTTAAVTTTAEPVTTEAVTEAPTESDTSAEVTAAPGEPTAEASTEADNDHLADAVRLFEALNTADMMQAGAGVDTDVSASREFTLKINGNDIKSEYFMVTDSRYTSLGQVTQFVNDNFSGALLEKYKNIYEGEGASFKEYNGNLYFTHAGRGSGFEYADAPVISDITDTAFTASVTVNSFGDKETFTIKAVKESDKWKASSLDIKKKQ
jgi:hypothetical protein